ncbi:MAG: hypothetical protein J6L82_00035 [Alphaproteobacteria bacterium]|nr:hypothetical protein [Alphaproteobacteria bacterium]
MAKEYKFMFDRRFDEPEEELPAVKEDLSAKSVDGIPSISELLDTLNEQIRNDAGQEQAEETPPEPAQAESAVPADQPEPPPAEETNATAAAQPSPEEELQAAVQSVQTALEQNVEPVFTQNEMDAAKNQAREEGRLQGLEEGRENAWQEAMVSIEKQNSDTLNAIDASLKELLARSQNDSQTAFTTAVGFAMAVCRKVVPALSEKNAVGEIQGLLEKNFHFLKDEPKISLRLNPFLADKVKPVLADLVKKESYAGKIAVIRDDSLPVGDCHVEWKNGGLQRNAQDVLNQTEELVKLYAQAAPQTEPAEEKTGEK